jgi:hypothetical protein
MRAHYLVQNPLLTDKRTQMTPKLKIQITSHGSPTRVTARRKMASLRVISQRRIFRVVVKRTRLQTSSIPVAVVSTEKLSID